MDRESLISSKVPLPPFSDSLCSLGQSAPQQKRIPVLPSRYSYSIQRAMDNEIQPIAVEILIRSKNSENNDSNFFKLERIWTSDAQEELKV